MNFDQRMIRICSSLQKAGNSVELVGRTLPQSTSIAPQNFKQNRLNCRFLKGPLFYLEYNYRLLQYFIKTKPDVINSVDLDTVIAAYLYRFLTKFVWVFDAHEHFTEVPEVTDRKFVKWIWQQVEVLVFRNAQKFYTVSASISNLYHKKYKKEVEVVRNVPFLRSLDVVKPRSDFSERFIIYQGALNEGRCIEYYIKAMKHIDAHLWIVGEGDLSNELRILAAGEGVEQKVTFKGRVAPDELRHLTQLAYMGLNVLENRGLSYYYSLSNKCFDYVQAGLPSISSNFPEYQLLNAEFETMMLIEPTLENVILAINELLQNTSKYNQLKENCTPAALAWNWQREEQKLLAIYE